VAQADSLHLPYRAGSFDAAICIAVLHHLSSWERRRAGVVEMLRVLRPGGRLLVRRWTNGATTRASANYTFDSINEGLLGRESMAMCTLWWHCPRRCWT
jgi:ubiquinone/menaquinone biosynthesis C-methylase UbiE